MEKIQLRKETIEALLELRKAKRVSLEGNILKIIDPGDHKEFAAYIKQAIADDKSKQKRRLDITKKIQNQNKQLLNAQDENERITEELRVALEETDNAKCEALNELDVLQKRTQFQLVQTIVKVALGLVIGVGVLTTILYVVSMFTNKDTQLIGTAWSNMFGILLTNAFSIIGTIMGVKYASNSKSDSES
jgi:hypothetical protein